MGHDVFLSYSSKDKLAADAACHSLERNGIRVWMAPRDILAGRGWAASIIRAINDAQIMVLVFSSNANTSPQIEREVERAINKGIPILPLRLEDVKPSDALEYFISAPHWMDAFTPPFEQHLERLAQAAKQLLASDFTRTSKRELHPEPESGHVKEESLSTTSPEKAKENAGQPAEGRHSEQGRARGDGAAWDRERKIGSILANICGIIVVAAFSVVGFARLTQIYGTYDNYAEIVVVLLLAWAVSTIIVIIVIHKVTHIILSRRRRA
jgi:hypothetical protein